MPDKYKTNSALSGTDGGSGDGNSLYERYFLKRNPNDRNPYDRYFSDDYKERRNKLFDEPYDIYGGVIPFRSDDMLREWNLAHYGKPLVPFAQLDKKSEVDKNAEEYDRRYRRMKLDEADRLSKLRYAPLANSLYEMYNEDNLVDGSPYEQRYYDTLGRSLISADAPARPVRYDRYDPEAEAARARALQAQAVRSTAAMYGNRPGMASGAIASLFANGNEQAGKLQRDAALQNMQIAQAEDTINTQTVKDWLDRRQAAAQHNSQLQYRTGDSVNEMWNKADEANRATRYGTRQSFYDNLMRLGQEGYNYWRSGVSALNGFESAGFHSPYERPEN